MIPIRLLGAASRAVLYRFAVLIGLGALACSPALGATAKAPYTWRHVTIVGGGFVDGIVFSENLPGLIFLRTDIGGAYRWDPGATHWVSMSHWISAADWNYTGTESIAADPTDANRVYIAAGSYTSSWAGNGAILRSNNRGRTWKISPLPFKNGGNEDGRFAGERLAVDPHSSNILYFGSRNNGLWRSADYGKTWSQVLSFPVTGHTNGIGVVFVDFARQEAAEAGPSKTIYVGVSDPTVGLYESTDAGATWRAAPGQPQGMLPYHGALASNGALYLTYGSSPGPNGVSSGAVWKWNTRSGHWTNVTPIPANGFGFAGLSVDARHPDTVMVSTIDRWALGDDAYRSIDGGATWISVRAHARLDDSASPWLSNKGQIPFGHWMGSLAIDPFHSGHVLFGTGWTCNGSEDVTAIDHGGVSHWSIHASGIEETVVNDVVSTPAGAHTLTAMWDLDGFRSVDLNSAPAEHYMPSWGRNESIDYAGQAPNIVVRLVGDNRNPLGAISRDNGRTWTAFGVTGTGDGAISISAGGGAIVATSSTVAPRVSLDGGKTWSTCSGLSQGAVVASDRVSPHVFYAYDSAAGTVLSSDDGGVSFGVLGSCPAKAAELRAALGTAGDVWLAGAAGVYHSPNGGRTWMQAPGFESATHVGFGKAAPSGKYAAVFVSGVRDGVYGFFRSDDDGQTWVRVNDAMHQFGSIDAISGDPRVYGRLYIASASFGVQYGDIGTPGQ